MADLEELSVFSDEDLEKIVLHGENNYVHNSRASIAKRILDNRREKNQIEIERQNAIDISILKEEAVKSGRELTGISEGLHEVIQILRWIKKHFLPKRPLWEKVGAFILGTIILGIALNLAADAIGKFWLGW